jgi:putative transposase
MRLTASEKEEIIRLVDGSDLGVNRTLRELGINKSTFYKWYQAYTDEGINGLQPPGRRSKQQWNTIPQEQKNLAVELALEHPQLSSRELSSLQMSSRYLYQIQCLQDIESKRSYYFTCSHFAIGSR